MFVFVCSLKVILDSNLWVAGKTEFCVAMNLWVDFVSTKGSCWFKF